MTASPMNFSTVPPWRSSTPFISSKKRDMTRRSDSGSRRSPRAVDPVTSAKSTVTVWRTSRPGVGASGAPQTPQKLKPSGFCWPQLGQGSTAKRVRWLARLWLSWRRSARRRRGVIGTASGSGLSRLAAHDDSRGAPTSGGTLPEEAPSDHTRATTRPLRVAVSMCTPTSCEADVARSPRENYVRLRECSPVG